MLHEKQLVEFAYALTFYHFFGTQRFYPDRFRRLDGITPARKNIPKTK